MIVEIVLVGVLALAAITLVIFVTYLYVHRIRGGEKGPKSFVRWVRDLMDVVSGLQ
jgi:hypothetical protein